SITGEALRKHAKKGFKILDIGCGTMMETRQLAGDCFVTGIDASTLMLDQAKSFIDPSNLDRVEFLKVGAELKQDIGKFDIIFSSFGYLESSSLEQFLSYAESHLSEEGKIIFTLWNRLGLMDILLSIATLKIGYLGRKLVSSGDITIGRYPLPVHPRLPRNTSKRNLRLKELSGICVILPPYNYTRLGCVLLKHGILARLDRILSRVPLFRYLGDFSLLVMARR
ncbi:methyltransferase type 11, partial [mine drainage metagenome]